MTGSANTQRRSIHTECTHSDIITLEYAWPSLSGERDTRSLRVHEANLGKHNGWPNVNRAWTGTSIMDIMGITLHLGSGDPFTLPSACRSLREASGGTCSAERLGQSLVRGRRGEGSRTRAFAAPSGVIQSGGTVASPRLEPLQQLEVAAY